jgi:hypothetical protein
MSMSNAHAFTDTAIAKPESNILRFPVSAKALVRLHALGHFDQPDTDFWPEIWAGLAVEVGGHAGRNIVWVRDIATRIAARRRWRDRPINVVGELSLVTPEPAPKERPCVRESGGQGR